MFDRTSILLDGLPEIKCLLQQRQWQKRSLRKFQIPGGYIHFIECVILKETHRQIGFHGHQHAIVIQSGIPTEYSCEIILVLSRVLSGWKTIVEEKGLIKFAQVAIVGCIPLSN